MSGKQLTAYVIMLVFIGWCWVTNFIKLTECDFKAPYKCESLHAIGIYPPVSVITTFITTNEK